MASFENDLRELLDMWPEDLMADYIAACVKAYNAEAWDALEILAQWERRQR